MGYNNIKHYTRYNNNHEDNADGTALIEVIITASFIINIVLLQP